jgi:UDP-2,3-diacylglucosamine pyrophosphatase LpxH
MLVIVSDLHLSEGVRPATQKLAPTEDFFFDEEFARFLAYLHSTEPGGVHLVVNGDMLDFQQVGVDEDDLKTCPCLAALPPKDRAYILRYGAKTDEASSVFKLDKIARGHPVFFRALGGFVSQGNRLTIVSGNHDVELLWPRVRERFRALITQKEPDPLTLADGGNPAGSVEFAPWIYYEADFRLYVEHGHQYESLNSFKYWLYPVLPKRPTEINLPFGSLFVRYLLNKVEELNPFADNIRPNTKYISWVIKHRPLHLRRLFWLLGRFFVTLAKAYRRSGNLSHYEPADKMAFQAETQRRLRQTAERLGVDGDPQSPEHPLSQVLGLHQLPLNEGRPRFLWRALLSNIDVFAFLLSGAALAAFVALAWLRGYQDAFASAALGLALLGALAGNAYSRVGEVVSRANLRAAGQIGRIFRESGNDLKYVVFGHSHQPAIERLDDLTYFNTGTWTVIFDDEAELLREKKEFACLICTGPGAEPRLMRWNDCLGAPETLPLFDSPEPGI